MGVYGLVRRNGRPYHFTVRLSDVEKEQLDTLINHFVGFAYIGKSPSKSVLFRELLDKLVPNGEVELYTESELQDAFWEGYFKRETLGKVRS